MSDRGYSARAPVARAEGVEHITLTLPCSQANRASALRS